MGAHVNPSPTKFHMDKASEIYIDKSLIIEYLNSVACTTQRYVCSSRPRRFGKTMATDMITAYYNRTLSVDQDFEGMEITKSPSFHIYANRFDSIKINMQEYLSAGKNIDAIIQLLSEDIEDELTELYPNVKVRPGRNLTYYLQKVFAASGVQFVVIIDEWDCIFREFPHDVDLQTTYLDFLRDFFKDRDFLALVYMTGILPIKKYGTHSALNMFTELSMEDPGRLGAFVGFSDEEVMKLCERYHMDFEECKSWYNGYYFPDFGHVYNPNSIVRAMLKGRFADYWNQTETFEALKVYLDMNFDGLKDSILRLMAGDRQKIDTGSFQNDMTTFSNKDDVMTLLIHLGYLGYNFETAEVFIPNREIMKEFVTATTAGNPWSEVVKSVKNSDELLAATWQGDEQTVAEGVENAHLETSHLQYNDENALSYTISLAYYSARQYYTVIRELPSGKGFADLVFVPRRKYSNKPAMVVELKWNHSAETAISQILKNQYPMALEDWKGQLLLVGINYDKKSREHTCKIQKL